MRWLSWLPGWTSAEDSGTWGHFWFWVGIVCLVVMAVSETLAHFYDLRKDELVAVGEAQRIAEQNKIDERRNADEESARGEQRRKDAERDRAEKELRDKLSAAEAKGGELAKQTRRLEAHAASRSLTPQQRTAIIHAIAPFRGQDVNFVSVLGDSEGDHYLREIGDALREGGWHVDESKFAQAVMAPSPIGLQVQMNDAEARAGRVPKAFEALIDVLTEQGVLEKKVGTISPGVPVGVITVVVGTKPALGPEP